MAVQGRHAGWAERLLVNKVVKPEQLTYSIAGRVSQPDLDCHVISGGFSAYSDDGRTEENSSGANGLICYLRKRQDQGNTVDLIIDATHPFAEVISRHALRAAEATNTDCWQLRRTPWPVVSGMRHEYSCYEKLVADAVEGKASGPVFLAIGHPDKTLCRLLDDSGLDFVLRSVTKPGFMPKNTEWIQDRGPFSRESEQSLFRHYKIGALICKNSGGTDTDAKLLVAAETGIPVYMKAQPVIPEASRIFFAEDECLRVLSEL